jgi:pyruvyl transferase EpsO
MPLTSEYAIDFMSQYDEVYSTRLHGGILAMLLGKKVHMIDNTYGKISSLYNTWLTKKANIDMVQ